MVGHKPSILNVPNGPIRIYTDEHFMDERQVIEAPEAFLEVTAVKLACFVFVCVCLVILMVHYLQCM